MTVPVLTKDRAPAVVQAARAAHDDAAAAWQRAAAKIAPQALPAPPPGLTDLTIRLADLEIDRDIAASTALFHGTERTAVSALSRRDELRGLLGAYQAKSARLGAAEDPGLTERYDRAGARRPGPARDRRG